MQPPIEYDIMFPVRMTSELKSEGQAAAKILGMNFSQFVRQSIRRNIAFTLERSPNKRNRGGFPNRTPSDS